MVKVHMTIVQIIHDIRFSESQIIQAILYS